MIKAIRETWQIRRSIARGSLAAPTASPGHRLAAGTLPLAFQWQTRCRASFRQCCDTLLEAQYRQTLGASGSIRADRGRPRGTSVSMAEMVCSMRAASLFRPCRFNHSFGLQSAYIAVFAFSKVAFGGGRRCIASS